MSLIKLSSGPFIGTPKGLLKTLITRNIFISSFEGDSSTNCKNAQRIFKNKRSRVEEEASQKNQADETGQGRHRSATWRTGHAADRANIKKQTVRSDGRGHGKSRRRLSRGFAKESGGWNRPGTAQERYIEDGSYDRANIKKQPIRSYGRDRSRTRKIEEEALQKDQADETGRGGHRVKWALLEESGSPRDCLVLPMQVENCQG